MYPRARARAHAPAPPRQRSEPKQRMDTCAAIAIKKRAENGRQNATHFFLCFFTVFFFLSSVSVPFFYFPPAPAFYSFASQFTRIHCETAASHQDQDRTSDPLVPGWCSETPTPPTPKVEVHTFAIDAIQGVKQGH